MSHRKGRPSPLSTSIRSVEEVVVARRMFAHDILRTTLATSSSSPGPTDKDRRLHHHQLQEQQEQQHQQHQKLMSNSNRAAFSPSTTASTVARAGIDGVSCAYNLLGSFNSTTGDYSPPPSQGSWANGMQLHHGSSTLRSDDVHDASLLYGNDDDYSGSARGAREEVLAAKLQQLQDEKASMAEHIRVLQGQLTKRPKSPPITSAADKSALLPRMLKDSIASLSAAVGSLHLVYATPSPSESSAATKIATAWRRLRRRKLYMQGMVAVQRWQQQQTAELLVPLQLWFDARAELLRNVHALKMRVVAADFKAAFKAWRLRSESTLPTRVNMRQRAYFMVLRVERSFLRSVMTFWEQITLEMRQGRTKASRWNVERERLRGIIMQEEEAAGNTYIDPHTVTKMLRVRWEQHSKQVVMNIMHHNIKILTWAILRHRVRLAYKKNISNIKANRHANTRACLRVLGAWRKSCKGSTKPGGTRRYNRKRNLNRIFYMLNSSLLLVAFGQWRVRVGKMKRLAQHLKIRKMVHLQRIFPVWLDDSKRTRSIKASVVERWLIISRYRLQAPFHSWFLFCQDVKFRERAQKSIVEVMSVRWRKIRQRRVFASWRGQLQSQQIVGRAKEDLVRMLNDATELGKALEDNVQKYRELFEVTKTGLQAQTELVAAREGELISREEELVDLRLRVAAADDEIQRLREIVDKGPELRTYKKANTYADNALLFEKRSLERQRGGGGHVLSARANLQSLGRGGEEFVEGERRHAVSARGAGGGVEEEILLGRAKRLCMIASGAMAPLGAEEGAGLGAADAESVTKRLMSMTRSNLANMVASLLFGDGASAQREEEELKDMGGITVSSSSLVIPPPILSLSANPESSYSSKDLLIGLSRYNESRSRRQSSPRRS